ncbi:hypothetical protein SDC9_107141 [bioreactor metagenome]|uniref:Uncharacterized protein n=1 Tax=bioreactor metagenome TaxID=1076179 RepID=A0A645B496_9ZZZZ
MERISHSMDLSDVGGSKPEIRARVVMVDVKIAGIMIFPTLKIIDINIVAANAATSTLKENLRQKGFPSTQSLGI